MRVQAGATDVTTYFHLRNEDGSDATGLTITDLDLQYTRTGASPAAKVDATALAAANSAHGDNQAFEIDDTDQPGVYRVDWPDAAFAAGVPNVYLTVKCTGVRTETLLVQLDTQEAKIDTIDNFLDTEMADTLAAVDTEVAAIKAKTDAMTFTATNFLQVDLKRINGTVVNGDGGATPWGP